ncbi:flagellar filament capping protein FliD [Clostridium frigidicarnis]|uniref:Flagellar hook-associated protein 2 n=1 Tax=Clostridium frigidicarnis TaxID=84698 RepID=A0A1I0VEI9_9CLOT|nr:flagellar filament capping protein FliD [Clostridium frigidicarnis]SFA74467.1 flagellar hook-associated protein 2 [Clostridium frigidicarnis]
MRINGFSGIDVDTMVKDMMKPYNVKVDKQKQQRDLIKWKQDLYRDVTKDMRGMYNKYFDVLSKDYLLSTSNLSSTKAESKDSSILNVSGLSGAKSGTYKVNIDKLATTASVKSEINLKDGINTKLDLDSDVTLTFNINGKDKEVVIKQGSTVEEMMNTINGSLKDSDIKASYSEFTGGLTIENTKTGNNSSLQVKGLDNIKIDGKAVFGIGGTTLTKGDLDFTEILAKNKELSLSSLKGNTIKFKGKDTDGNEVEKEVVIEEEDTIESLEKKLTDEGATVNFEDGKLKVNDEEKLDARNAITKDTSLKPLFGKELQIGDEKITIQDTDTLESLALKINKTTERSVSLAGGKIALEVQGDKAISFSDSGVKVESQKFNEINGHDAEFEIILPGSNKPIKQTSEKNIFTKDNITFNFNDIGETTFTVKNDVSGAVDKITGFIDDYNKLVSDMYSKVTTKKNKMGEYLPLTDEQKKDMSEDEIKRWEEKGKTGLLKGDMLLNSILGDMRGVFDSYTGMGKELNKIGISLSEDTTKPNCLDIDKDKLAKALENDGEDVINMLISTEQIQATKHNGEPIVDSKGKPVMVSKGVFAKLKDKTRDACMKYQSTLSEKAGVYGATGDDELSKAITKRNDKIKEMEKDLQVREQAFYVKFSRLEQAMNKFNSQQSALSQQFGGM